MTLGAAGGVIGDANTAAGFSGASQYVSVPYSGALNPAGAFTVEALVNPSSLVVANGTDPRPIVASRDPGMQQGYMLYQDGYFGQPQFAFIIGTGAPYRWVYQASGLPLAANTWYHVVGMWDGTSVRLFVNGVDVSGPQQGSGVLSPISGVPLRMGRCDNCSGTSKHWQGTLDEVAVYPRALSASEVAQHFAEARGAFQPVEQTRGVCGAGSIALAICNTLSDPVNTLTGAFTHAETDLTLASTGVPFELTRSYTSADPTVGRFGPGWTDNYAISLAVQPNGDVVAHGEEGQLVTFASLGGGVFDGGPGARAVLETVAGGYRLTRNDQVVFEFDTAGKLLSKRDRNGQGVTLAYDGQGRLQTVTDAAANTATYSYNASSLVSGVLLSDGRSVSYGYTSGRLTSFTDVRGKPWSYTYDAGGRLATIVDPLTHVQVTNVYDATSGRISAQTDAVGKTTQFVWDAATQTATVTDPNQNVWQDGYVNNVLFRRIDGASNATELGHDADLNGTSVKGPSGETTQMTYDASGNLLQATAPPSLGSVQKTFVYNADNDPTTVTDARGKITSYTYTPAGNVATATQDGVQVASYTYDGLGRVQTSTDGNSKTTGYTYDADGNVASVTSPDPDGAGPLASPVTTYTYDAMGNVLTRVDPKGNVAGCGCASQYTTTFTYNQAGQQLTETDPLGHVTQNVYDDAGRLSSTTDANNHTTSYAYDNANRVLSETGPDPDGAGPLQAPVTSYTYDDAGNKLTETGPDPDGAGPLQRPVTTYAYDAANRLVSTTGPDPDGAGPMVAPLTTNTYDVNGNLASTVEPRGNVQGANPDDFRTTYTYDAAGRLLTTTTDADGTGPGLPSTTTNVYDPVGNLSSVTDANQHVTSYTYDAAGRILTVTAPDPDGGGPLASPVTTYTYDPVGNRLTRRDDNQHVTTWLYDALNRVTSVTAPDPDGGGAQTSSVTSYTYDVNSNQLTVTDANGNGTGTAGDGTTTYAYDNANRLTSINYSDATPDVTFTLDNAGNRLSMVDGSGTQTTTYDNLDRLKTVTRGTSTFSYVYDAAGNVTKRTYPDATVVDYTYDPLGRMQTAASGGRTTSYAYDPASNLTTTTLPSANGYVETRTYDNAGRLMGVRNVKGASTLADIVYTRDPVGNPLTETRTGASPVSKTFGYDQMDRLTSVCYLATTCPGAADPFIRWTYDGVGNRLSEARPGVATTSYTYDQMDRMLSAGATAYTYDRNGNELSAGTRTFTYDLANRVKTTAQSGTTTTYTYDGDGIRLQASTGSQASKKTNFLWDVNHGLPMLAREDNGNGALQRRYVVGRQPIFMSTTSSNAWYFHYDPLGSVRNVTSSSGATQLTYDYEPYGAIRSSSGTSPTNFVKFTGEYQDPTGLYHLRARQYDPAIGRFASTDPVAGSPSSPAVSQYLYAAGQPTVMLDPSGQTIVSASIAQEEAAAASSLQSSEDPSRQLAARLFDRYVTIVRLRPYTANTRTTRMSKEAWRVPGTTTSVKMKQIVEWGAVGARYAYVKNVRVEVYIYGTGIFLGGTLSLYAGDSYKNYRRGLYEEPFSRKKSNGYAGEHYQEVNRRFGGGGVDGRISVVIEKGIQTGDWVGDDFHARFAFGYYVP